jgi:hypothetical protein
MNWKGSENERQKRFNFERRLGIKNCDDLWMCVMILDKQKKMETQNKGREKTKQFLSIFQNDCFCHPEKISGAAYCSFIFHLCVIIFYI